MQGNECCLKTNPYNDELSRSDGRNPPKVVYRLLYQTIDPPINQSNNQIQLIYQYSTEPAI